MVEFPQLGIEHWIAIVSSVLALISFGFNVRLIARQERREKASLRLQKDGDLIAWADQAIAALGRVQGLLRERGRLIDADEFARLRSQCRTDVSVIADRGRLFFPGEVADAIDDESAYSGEIDPVIASLEDTLGLLKAIDKTGNTYDRDDVLTLVKIRRSFVNRVFDAVDPRRREREFDEIN